MIDPTSNDDFETVIAAMRIPDLDEGHQCYPIPNPAADVEAGSNATLQIKYTSDFDTDKNETFYACADITYVPTSQFSVQVPCFNATIDDYDITDTNDGDDGDESDDSNSSSSTSTASGTAAGATSTSSPSASSSSSSSGLSGGAIAGIVVGVVLGALLAFGGAFYLWRRSQQKKRRRQQEANIRNVKWEQGANSDNDIALRQI
jgi:hypothetical protein